MAQRLSYICEVCLDQGEETIAAPAYVALDDVAGMLDLCKQHRAAILEPLLKLLKDSGRPAGGASVSVLAAGLPAGEQPRRPEPVPRADPGTLRPVEREQRPEPAEQRFTDRGPFRPANAEPTPAPAPAPAPVERVSVDRGTVFRAPVAPSAPVVTYDGLLAPPEPDPEWLDQPVPVDQLPDELRGWPCPGCLGNPEIGSFPSPLMLSLHTIKAHGVKMTDVYAAIGKCRFPACGYDPDEPGDDGLSLGEHVSFAHQVGSLSTMISVLALYDPLRVDDLLMMFWAGDERVAAQGTLV